MEKENATVLSYLPFIPRSPACSQDAILDTARRQMVQDRMIRHRQYARIVLVWGRRVEDALAEEHG